MISSRLFRVLFASLALALSPAICAHGQTQNPRGDGPQAEPEGGQVWAKVSQMPFTAEGSGVVLYVIAYSTCPYASAFYTDWNGKLDGVEIRWVFYPIDDPTANAAGELAVSRDAKLIGPILRHQHVSPPVRQSQTSVSALNAVISEFNGLNATFANFHHYHIISPTFIWQNGGQVLVSRGYERRSFESQLLPNLLRRSH